VKARLHKNSHFIGYYGGMAASIPAQYGHPPMGHIMVIFVQACLH
jgi:hypothetical protein